MLIKSICPYCGVGCGMLLEAKKGKVVKVHPQKYHPVTKGELCIKGVTIDKVINHKDRLKKPLIKKNGLLKEVSWTEALNFAAGRLKEIKSAYGSDSIGIFASSKCTSEENYITQKFARVVIGTNNIDNCTRLCHAPSVFGMHETLGKSAMTNTYEDLPQSKCILIFGSDPASNQPVGFNRLIEIKKSGGKIITIDVRRTPTAEKSDLFLQINHGSDAMLAAGIAKFIIDEGLENKKFIKNSLGYEEFFSSLTKISMSEIEETTGISEKKIKELSLLYANNNSAIIMGMGLTQQRHGVETVLALTNLALLTGNIGRPGTGLNPLRGCNNVQGSCDMGCLPDFYPGHAAMTEENIARFEKLWKCKIPAEKGLTECEMVSSSSEKIRAMYIIGENPMVSHPDLNETESNLKNLQLLIVQDVFLTETAALADVVFPAACFAEKTGTYTNTERRVQLAKKTAKPPGEAKNDLAIISLMAKKMGHKLESKPERVFDEIRKAVPHYSGMTYKKLQKQGICWPCDSKNRKGTKILYQKPEKKFVFYPIAKKYIEKSDYPFVLVSHRELEQYNTRTFTNRVEALKKRQNCLEINKNDADELGIRNGNVVKIISENGELIIQAKISDKIKSGLLSIDNDIDINRLTSSRLDPISKIPEFKNCRVKLEKIK